MGLISGLAWGSSEEPPCKGDFPVRFRRNPEVHFPRAVVWCGRAWKRMVSAIVGANKYWPPTLLLFLPSPSHNTRYTIILWFYTRSLTHFHNSLNQTNSPLKKTSIKMQFNIVALSVAALVATAAAQNSTTGNGYVWTCLLNIFLDADFFVQYKRNQPQPCSYYHSWELCFQQRCLWRFVGSGRRCWSCLGRNTLKSIILIIEREAYIWTRRSCKSTIFWRFIGTMDSISTE